jgi:hypothetical protein
MVKHIKRVYLLEHLPDLVQNYSEQEVKFIFMLKLLIFFDLCILLLRPSSPRTEANGFLVREATLFVIPA